MTDHAEVLQRLVEASERYEKAFPPEKKGGPVNTEAFCASSDLTRQAANSRASLKAALSELEALRAMVARLPKDRYGRPVQMGDTIACEATCCVTGHLTKVHHVAHGVQSKRVVIHATDGNVYYLDEIQVVKGGSNVDG